MMAFNTLLLMSGFGTSGFITAIEDSDGNLIPPAGSEGFVLVEVSDGVETRVNELFNRTVLTENRWVKMFAHAVEHTLTVGVDLDGDGRFERGALVFQGRGKDFVHGFYQRIDRILESSGAYYDGRQRDGHAQRSRHLLANVIYGYPQGDRQGMCPTLDFRN